MSTRPFPKENEQSRGMGEVTVGPVKLNGTVVLKMYQFFYHLPFRYKALLSSKERLSQLCLSHHLAFVQRFESI